MIGFIKNLFSGILSFFVGLFAGKKSQPNNSSIKASDNNVKPALDNAKKPAVAASKKRKRSGYFMELDEDEEIPVNGSQPKVGVKTPEPVAAKSTKTEPVAATKSTKAQSAKSPEPATDAQPPQIELVQTAEGVRAQPAKPVSSSVGASANGQKPAETTFAPKYLAPTPNASRRRPGPSMNPFLDMAREVKTPN